MQINDGEKNKKKLCGALCDVTVGLGSFSVILCIVVALQYSRRAQVGKKEVTVLIRRCRFDSFPRDEPPYGVRREALTPNGP